MASIRLEAIQIEVSTACTLQCDFCPVTHLPEKPLIMPMSLYNKIVPMFARTNWVYLQGWGEPLLNKNIWKMAAMAKEAGSKVGLTTNGTLLNGMSSEKAIENLDHISISLVDGLDTSSAISELLLRRGRQKVPRVSLALVLTKDSISRIPEVVVQAAELGVDEVYFQNLDYVYNHQADALRIFAWDGGPSPEYKKILTLAKAQASRYKVPVRFCSLTAIEQSVCDLDPNRFVFITVTGEVVPCVYLARHVNTRVYAGNIAVNPRKSFGKITEQEFSTIWEDTEYRKFREHYREREKACRYALQILGSCDASFSALSQVDKVWDAQLRQNPMPKECVGCPKVYGL